MLRMIEAHSERLCTQIEQEFDSAIENKKELDAVFDVWKRDAKSTALLKRFEALRLWASKADISSRARLEVVRVLDRHRTQVFDVVELWSELLSDRIRIGRYAQEYAPGEFSETELNAAHGWCVKRCAQVLNYLENAVHRIKTLVLRMMTMLTAQMETQKLRPSNSTVRTTLSF